ncbi:shikimate dehydrogenase [Synechococcus sp. CBW1004]|uniref:shikimate dehydrogenase n=1 Tax=Synechococcus sp. CBW1004 TaxID=1353136 RepID=UPI0018CE0081|nr:shikimate dehydrogenase [Synechococcus sp. CBW1004]QPN62506.1 shikimate dehydrogenase [Synechococcus sp. CBW1004]
MSSAIPSPSPIRGSTAFAGVLGDPVRHSLSPVMHNAALASLDLDWVYLALPVAADRLATVVQALEAMGCRGLSVTIPHKQAVAALCRELSPLAERLGAVNTLVPHPQGGWFGTNTDVEGFCAPLLEDGTDWQGRRAVVLGSGGSARAVAAALVELGFADIQLAGRRAAALEAFRQDCAAWAPQLRPLVWTAETDGLAAELATADLVVNTTPLGMASASDSGAASRCPLSEHELDALPPSCWVYDVIYTPRPTELLRRSSQRGCRSLDGLEMLVQQGAAALRLWSGRTEVPVGRMREAALAALERCG